MIQTYTFFSIFCFVSDNPHVVGCLLLVEGKKKKSFFHLQKGISHHNMKKKETVTEQMEAKKRKTEACNNC